MDKKQRIIFTTLELVVKQGVHATPMSQIARESRVSIGTIYNHFIDKEDLLCYIYKMIRKDFGSILIRKDESKSPEEIFKKYWKDLYQYYINSPVAFHFYEYIAKPPVIPLTLIDETKVYFREHADFFWYGVEKGFLKNIHVSLLVQLAYSSVVAAVNLKLNGVLPMTNEQVNEAANASWDAVRLINNG